MNYGMDFQGGDSGGGGGFSNGDNNYGGGSQGSTEKKRRNYDEQTLIPVTLSMVHGARQDSSGGDNTLALEDGRPLHSIKLIAAVRECNVQSTNIMYTLEDGTGALDVKQWADDNDGEAVGEMKRKTAQANIYVKVIGQVSEYNGKIQVVANSVTPLSTGNELTHHMLEVIYSAEKYKQADSIVSAPIVQSGGMAFNNYNNNKPKVENDGNSSTKERVLAYLKHNDSEAGAPIENCIAEMSDVAEADIRTAVEDLSENGQIYSTINESYFKVAE